MFLQLHLQSGLQASKIHFWVKLPLLRLPLSVLAGFPWTSNRRETLPRWNRTQLQKWSLILSTVKTWSHSVQPTFKERDYTRAWIPEGGIIGVHLTMESSSQLYLHNWFFSLSIMSSSFIHVTLPCVRVSFLLRGEETQLCVHAHFYPSSVDGHFGLLPLFGYYE